MTLASSFDALNVFIPYITRYMSVLILHTNTESLPRVTALMGPHKTLVINYLPDRLMLTWHPHVQRKTLTALGLGFMHKQNTFTCVKNLSSLYFMYLIFRAQLMCVMKHSNYHHFKAVMGQQLSRCLSVFQVGACAPQKANSNTDIA
jgi:hypothetical protein